MVTLFFYCCPGFFDGFERWDRPRRMGEEERPSAGPVGADLDALDEVGVVLRARRLQLEWLRRNPRGGAFSGTLQVAEADAEPPIPSGRLGVVVMMTERSG